VRAACQGKGGCFDFRAAIVFEISPSPLCHFGLKLKYQDIEVGVDLAPEPGLADNGDLEQDLQALLGAVGTAAQKAGTALITCLAMTGVVERPSDNDPPRCTDGLLPWADPLSARSAIARTKSRHAQACGHCCDMHTISSTHNVEKLRQPGTGTSAPSRHFIRTTAALLDKSAFHLGPQNSQPAILRWKFRSLSPTKARGRP